MNSESVIALSAKMLNMKEDELKEGERTLELMTVALNNVISEIAEEYVPFIRSEKVNFLNGNIPYSSLSEQVKEVLKITVDKKAQRFTKNAEGVSLRMDAGEAEVTYSYIPQGVGYKEEFYLPVGITERTVASGVAGEYALMCERYEECVNYDNRFMSGIKSASRSSKSRRLPYWRWI